MMCSTMLLFRFVPHEKRAKRVEKKRIPFTSKIPGGRGGGGEGRGNRGEKSLIFYSIPISGKEREEEGGGEEGRGKGGRKYSPT